MSSFDDFRFRMYKQGMFSALVSLNRGFSVCTLSIFLAALGVSTKLSDPLLDSLGATVSIGRSALLNSLNDINFLLASGLPRYAVLIPDNLDFASWLSV